MNKQVEEMAKLLCNNCAGKESPCAVAKSGEMCRSIQREAESLYTAGYRKQKWISVEERLPENSNHYLVCAHTHYGTNFVTLALYTISCGWNGVRVTHWMPLPMPPKGDVGE